MNEVAAIILAAGCSTRFGEDKIFKQLLGRPLLDWTLDPFLRHPCISRIILVVHSQKLAHAQGFFQKSEKVKAIIPGGKERQESVRAGLAALGEEPWVLVHDGARPCLSDELLSRILAELELFPAVTPLLPVRETIKTCGPDLEVTGTLGKEGYYFTQTPQGFWRNLLLKAHEQAREKVNAIDDASLVEELGEKVHGVLGEERNLKVTTLLDLLQAECILKEKKGS